MKGKGGGVGLRGSLGPFSILLQSYCRGSSRLSSFFTISRHDDDVGEEEERIMNILARKSVFMADLAGKLN